MFRNIFITLFSISFFLTVSCAHQKPIKTPLILAIGYDTENRALAEKHADYLKSKLSKNFIPQTTFLATDDIDFEKKDVSWDVGIGLTTFALKELHHQIKFTPFAWENSCILSYKFYKNRNANKKLKSAIIVNEGYLSPHLLIPLYPHLDLETLELVASQELLEEKLKKRTYDIIIANVIQMKTDQLTILKGPVSNFEHPQYFTSGQLASENYPHIPCRTFFYSPRMSLSRVKTVMDHISNQGESGNKNNFFQLIPVDLAQFEYIQKVLRWDYDEMLRKIIKTTP